MTADEIVERILNIAADEPEELLEMSAMSVHEELYDAAVAEFGGWDGALIRSLTAALDSGRSTSSSGRSSTDTDEQIEREVTEAYHEPVFAVPAGDGFYKLPGDRLEVSERPIIPDTPPGTGAIWRLLHVGEPDGVMMYTDRGNHFGLDIRMVPEFDGEMLNRRVQDVLGLADGERIIDAVPRRNYYSGRFIHITRKGKGKASDVSEVGHTFDREGRQAFKLNDGDEPVAVMAGPEETTVFCASAMGKAIHFEASDIRTMGLKAVGVNVMKLDGERDEIVGACLGDGVEQVALITEQGMGKRVDFGEFRTQGRAGAGLQLLRLEAGDHVAAVTPCEPGGDLVITTSNGRLHRMPAGEFALMGRPAKGNQMIELVDDERVVGLSRLPCGSE